MKQKLCALALAGALTLSLVGCGGDAANTSSGSTGDDLQEFNVVLDWYPNAIHCFIYNAIEKGYYEEEGLKVNIQFPANTNDAISLTAAGKADVGIYYPHDVIVARANEDVPIKSIGTITHKGLNIILSLKEKNITSPKDLVGKKLGGGSSVLQEVTIRTMMEYDGATAEDLEIVDVGFDLMNAMTTGNVDATIGCMVNHEVPQMEEEGFEVNYFFPQDYGVPEGPEMVFVTGDKQLEEEREQLEGFLRASKKGFEDMKNDPEGSLELLLANQNEENFPLSPTVEQRSMEMLLPIMEEADKPFMSQDESQWQASIDWLVEQGVLTQSIDASEVMVNLLD
ncbi:MAG: ABC transporter substrate-binding protein [Eubacteriales bacterium]|jgi:putative hydroxymethylpyrimidine transport system substrate-binding protein